MKTPLRRLLPALLCLLPGPAAAGPPAVHQYHGTIEGVACAACSKKINTSLEKLPGVTSIKLVPNAESGIAKVEIVSTSEAITKDAAIKALGKEAENYTILTLEETKAK